MDLALLGAFVVAVFLLTVAPGPDMLFVLANALAGGRRAGLVAALGMSTGLALHTFAAALGLSALLAAAPQALDVVRLLGAAFLVYLAVHAWRSSGAATPGPATPAPPATPGSASPAPPAAPGSVAPGPVGPSPGTPASPAGRQPPEPARPAGRDGARDAIDRAAGPTQERTGQGSLRKVYLLATLTNLGNPKIVLFYLAFLPQFLTISDTAWPVWSQLLVLGALFIAVGLPVDAAVGLTAGTFAERLFRWPSFRRRLERVSALVFAGLAARLLLDARDT
ncbi:LysE family translocator [Plantactinospora sp. WMMB782]|uniref:LysE family translocator n=1 Tax=Plantactinospora sp. WMMB782 TaxID=3404121 RepID=UPI003B965BA3